MLKVRFPRRKNLVACKDESWRPPLIRTPKNRWQRLSVAIRRFFDLQAGSIWNDLVPILADVRGAVLDVGCGSQPYRCLLPAEAQYLGIDTPDGREHFGYAAPDTLLYTTDQWPVVDQSIDLVLMTETLEHVYEALPFLREAHRSLGPGGLLLITVPFSARWHFVPHDFWRFTPSCLQRLLEEAGFGQIAIYARGNGVTVACYKAMILLLPLLLPRQGNVALRLAKQTLGLILSPLIVFCALLGNLSLKGSGGDDCLGYTVIARKPVETEIPLACRTPRKMFV